MCAPAVSLFTAQGFLADALSPRGCRGRSGHHSDASELGMFPQGSRGGRNGERGLDEGVSQVRRVVV